MATFSGVTGAIGGSEIFQGGVFTTSVAIVGVTVGMAVTVTPRTFPGNGAFWLGYVSAPGVVTVKVGATIAMTVAASIYDIQVNDGASVQAIIFAQTADATINTGGFASLVGAGAGSVILPANYFAAPGACLHVAAAGSIVTPAAGGGGQFRMVFGSVILCSLSAGLLAANQNAGNSAWSIDLYITARTVGATGRMDASGAGVLGQGGTAANAGPFFFQDNQNLVDTTGPLTFDFRWNWTTFNAGCAITCTNLVLTPL